MDQSEKRSIHWEKWTAVGTVVMAVCALITSLWQGYTLQQHNKLSLRPYLEFEANFQRMPDKRISFELLVNNNGIGPAEVTQMNIWLGGEQISSTHRIWPTLKVAAPPDCLGAGNVARFYKVDDQQMVIRADEKCLLTDAEYQKLQQQLRIELTYQSLYGDSYQVSWGEPAARG